MVHFSEGTKARTMSRTCCMCGEEWVMTTEEYLFNKVGYKVVDRSMHLGTSNEPAVTGWCCDKCAAEVIRIRDL